MSHVRKSDRAELVVAVHEAGHAVARLVLNDRHRCSARIKLVTVQPFQDAAGRKFLGNCHHDPHVSRRTVDRWISGELKTPAPEDLPELIELDIIEGMTGPCAERYYLVGRHEPMAVTMSQPGFESDRAAVRGRAAWLGLAACRSGRRNEISERFSPGFRFLYSGYLLHACWHNW